MFRWVYLWVIISGKIPFEPYHIQTRYWHYRQLIKCCHAKESFWPVHFMGNHFCGITGMRNRQGMLYIMMTLSKWRHFPRYWSFVRRIYRSPVNSPHKGQWRWALVFSLICAWINGCVNNREAGDLRHHRAHYFVTVMISAILCCSPNTASQPHMNVKASDLTAIFARLMSFVPQLVYATNISEFIISGVYKRNSPAKQLPNHKGLGTPGKRHSVSMPFLKRIFICFLSELQLPNLYVGLKRC